VSSETRKSAEVHDVERFHVVVIGGGPAGSVVAAILARLGLQVAVIERGAAKGLKVGETLPGQARVTLAACGMDQVLQRVAKIAAAGNRSIWGSASPFERSGILSPYGGGWHIDRAAFDAALLQEAQAAGARLMMPASLGEVSRREGLWCLALRTPNGAVQIECEAVIDASGRTRAFARRLAIPQVKHDSLLGIARLFDCGNGRDVDTRTTIESAPLGWWYTARIPSDRRVVVYFTDIDLAREAAWRDDREWNGALATTTLIQPLVMDHRYRCCGSATNVVADTSRLELPGGEQWWAVGDAAASLDPLSSAGISHALQSAVAVAQCVAGGRIGDTVRWKASHDLQNRRRIEYYSIEKRWPVSPFWSRRQRKH